MYAHTEAWMNRDGEIVVDCNDCDNGIVSWDVYETSSRSSPREDSCTCPRCSGRGIIVVELDDIEDERLEDEQEKESLTEYYQRMFNEDLKKLQEIENG
jgi:transposase